MSVYMTNYSAFKVLHIVLHKFANNMATWIYDLLTYIIPTIALYTL